MALNEELLGLLRLLGVEGVDDPDAWRRVVMVLNFGVVPAPERTPAAGFKLLLLDRHEMPAWFARCSWASTEAMLSETALLEALTADPVARRHVPESRAAYTSRIFVQLSRHLGVRAYHEQLRSLSPERWTADVIEAVEASETVLRRAEVLQPDLRKGATLESRRRGLHGALTVLANAGMGPIELGHVATALEVLGELPFILQHGDLWPANLLRRDDRWWFIDFAECGHVLMPFYDIFHMLHSAPERATLAWYALDRSSVRRDRWTEARWAVLEHFRRKQGLEARQVGACLVFYLVHLASYRLRPGVERQWSDRLLGEIGRIANFLAAGGTLESLLSRPE